MQLTFSGWRPSIPLSSVSEELEHEDMDNPVSGCTAEEEEEEKRKM